jgi:hypothetical protein
MTGSPQNNMAYDFLLTPEQKKLKYEKNMKKLMQSEKAKITEDDKKNLIEKIKDITCEKEKQFDKYLSKQRSLSYNCSSYCKFI